MNAQIPLLDLPTETLLIRPEHGGTPRLYFKPRGNESVWRATLDKLIGKQNAPTISHQTLLAIGPWIEEACGEVAGQIAVADTNPSGKWTHRLRKTPTAGLKSIHGRLLEMSRTYVAHNLFQQHFPERMHEIGSNEAWEITFQRFLSLVNAEAWFPLDSEILDTAYNFWQGDELDDGEWLSGYMDIIPLASMAPTEEYPENTTLYGLLMNPWILRGELIPYGIDTQEDIDDATLAWRIYEREDEFATYEYPLNLLPDVVRMYRRETGYPILDEPGDPEGGALNYGYNITFTWMAHTDALRRQWSQASPLVDRFNAFHNWLDESDDHFDRVIHIILETGGML